jgi:SIR2-like domain
MTDGEPIATPERVVYVLGAGFSAPLGLPLASNFVARSREMYRASPERYAHFEAVFEAIPRLAVATDAPASGDPDIEELLAAVERRELVEGPRLKQSFVRYVCDVVRDLTPPGLAGDSSRASVPPLLAAYRDFAAALCNLAPAGQRDAGGGWWHSARLPARTEYAVVTVNYDRVLEDALEHARKTYEPVAASAGFRPPGEAAGADERWYRPLLAKLHGSAECGAIVPPAWRKRDRGPIRDAWRDALPALRAAGHVRIIGYSLRRSDVDTRFLLEAALTESRHLEQLDILCLDPSGETTARYDEFAKFACCRYKNDTVESYLGTLRDLLRTHAARTALEAAHRTYFLHAEEPARMVAHRT